MSETLLQRPTPVPQSPAREIINVDDFILSDDDVQIVVPRAARRIVQRRPQEIIVVDDSDDDVQEVPDPGGPSDAQNPPGRRRRGTPRIRRRALFSPSPPLQNNIIPPVPPLPPHAHEVPLRWRALPDFAGVLRPLERPFAFEEGIAGPRRTPDVRRRQRNWAAGNEAPRHPNMGLGGALYALNRHNQLEAARARTRRGAVQAVNAPNFNWVIPGLGAGIGAGFGALRRFLNFGSGSPEPVISEDEDEADLIEALELDADERQNGFQYFRLNREGNHVGRFMRHDDILPPRQVIPDYKQHFTHPEKPEPGFANEFAPQDPITISDEPGPSSTSTESGTILVCAQCLDPLVLNVIGSEDVVRRSRLWGLRCGHILDGKCIDTLMRPTPPPPMRPIDEMDVDALPTPRKWKGKDKAEDIPTVANGLSLGEGPSAVDGISVTEQSASSKRKGKRKASPLEEDVYVSPITPPQTDKKGKGRAYPPIPISTPATIADVPETRRQGEEVIPSLPVQLDSIRSRLRPRHLAIQAGPSTESVIEPRIVRTHDAVAPEEPDSFVPSASPTRGQRRGNGRVRGRRTRGGGAKGRGRGKSKGKAKAPVIEAEHFWFCPVSSCARKHKSVLIEGEWRMDSEQGAIAMYV